VLVRRGAEVLSFWIVEHDINVAWLVLRFHPSTGLGYGEVFWGGESSYIELLCVTPPENR